MTLTLSIILAALLIAWLAFFCFASRWPLKKERHSVFCPVQKKAAHVSFVHSRLCIGTYMPTDVVSCSLFPQGEMSCDRQCMS